MRTRQHGAGWSGPERGGEWCHIQLLAGHKWGMVHKWLFRAQYLGQFCLISLSTICMRESSVPSFCRWYQIRQECQSAEGQEGPTEGSGQALGLRVPLF